MGGTNIIEEDDGGNGESSLIENDNFCAKVGVEIRSWMLTLEKNGFIEGYEDNDDATEIENNPDRGLVIYDPYVEIDAITQVKEIEETDKKSLRGYCTALLHNGDRLSGKWKSLNDSKFIRCGNGSYDGDSLCVWGHYKNGILQGSGKAQIGNVIYQGNFKNGYLHGPVRGFLGGKLIWIGQYHRGKSFGLTWKFLEGGGWMVGNLDKEGKFTGNQIAYVYPDLITCLYGRFHDGKLMAGRESYIKSIVISSETRQCLDVDFTFIDLNTPLFKHWPSTIDDISCPPMQLDVYEKRMVYVKESGLGACAGDGLFARINIPSNTIVAFYNGIRVKPGEMPTQTLSEGYQIYIDWNKSKLKTSEYMDILPQYISLDNYQATLAHKINHSFEPNCRWETIQHPCFGRIPTVMTIKDVEAGNELTCHYTIDMEEADQLPSLEWYVKLWDSLNASKNII